MRSKLNAATIATKSGADMVIVNGRDMGIIHRIMDGDFIGTTFLSNFDEDFDLLDSLKDG
jgi:glutamate 5-kinase